MKKYKLSFLMAAHNEEKLISIALNRLVKIHKDYPNMEVLIGLDGCTDRTPKIVIKFTKKYKFIKSFNLNERKGKQAVLDKLNQHITGEIVLIHDADWIFTYENKEKLKEFIKLFENPMVGGITSGEAGDFFPEEKINSIGFLASAWGNHFLLDYLKKKQTKREGEHLFVDQEKMIFPFFLDFYKKSALNKTRSNKNLRAGDHIERTLRLLKSGYKIIINEDKDLPKMNIIYKELSLKDFIKQRIRGVISKNRVKDIYKTRANIFNFHIPFLIYTILHLYEIKRFNDLLGIFFYWFSTVYAMIVSIFVLTKETSVKQVWKMRMER
jgi:glycosyltransferase involved in cell wall biosynthesis